MGGFGDFGRRVDAAAVDDDRNDTSDCALTIIIMTIMICTLSLISTLQSLF